MIFNKYIFLLLPLFLLGCSTDDDIKFSNAVDVFQPKYKISFVNEKDKNNPQLAVPIDLKEILNSKTHNLINSQISFPLKKNWEIDTDQNLDDKNPYLPEPLFFESKIYLLNNKGYLFKINSENGKIIWKKNIFKDLKNTIIGTPALSGSKNDNNTITLFVHNGSDELLAVNGDDGKIIWKKKSGMPFRGGITSHKNLIFVSDFDGNFISINKKNGLTLWNIFLGSDYNSVYTTARPIIAKNKVVVPTTGGTFFVISIDTGEVLWSENLSSNQQLPKLFHVGDIVANPLYHEGILYIVSQSGVTAAFNIDNSEMLWNVPIGGFETPTISGKTIFISGNMGILAAIDTDSGRLRWQKKYPSYLNVDSFFSDEEIAIYKGPTLVNSKILLSNQKGLINIIDAKDGTKAGTLKVDQLAFSPIPVDGNLLFVTANGKLLSYK